MHQTHQGSGASVFSFSDQSVFEDHQSHQECPEVDPLNQGLLDCDLPSLVREVLGHLGEPFRLCFLHRSNRTREATRR